MAGDGLKSAPTSPYAAFIAAIAELTEGAGGAYDRRVVAALINRLENRGGREAWREMADEPAAV